MMLTLTLLLPLIGIFFVVLAGRVSAMGSRIAALLTSVVTLQVSYLMAANSRYETVQISYPWIKSFGVFFELRADWISSILVVLTSLLTVIAISVSWKEIKERVTSFHVCLLLLQTGVSLVFLAQDLMLFYLGWELMLIPMLFIIGSWGSGRKEYAAFKFVLFTFTGSIFMLASFFYVYYRYLQINGTATFQLDALLTTELTSTERWWVFLGLLIGFGVKAPIFPLHTWMLDAYPNAPTAGSLMLSGILSKTGVFGLFTIALPFAQDVFINFRPTLIVLTLIGIFYGAWIALSQRDIKRLIAYSSFSHVSFILLGLFVLSPQGFTGSVLQMISHGLATAGLFLIAGAVQNRLRTRDFTSLGGLWTHAPAMGGFLLFFSFASLGLPGTANFVGELYIIGAALKYNWIVGGLAALAVLLAAAYSLRLFTGIMHGTESARLEPFPDNDNRENLLLVALATCLILIGFFPSIITGPLAPRSSSISKAANRESIQLPQTTEPQLSLLSQTMITKHENPVEGVLQ